jgi:hypothetical protein
MNGNIHSREKKKTKAIIESIFAINFVEGREEG